MQGGGILYTSGKKGKPCKIKAKRSSMFLLVYLPRNTFQIDNPSEACYISVIAQPHIKIVIYLLPLVHVF
jgi:hypothetical protein